MGEIEIENYQFEWDDEKNEKNFKKHKIHFEEAIHVFFDDNRYEEFDEKHSIDEDRYKTVGMVRGILAVIHTERGEKIRLISARPADKSEVKKYYGQFDNF